MGVNSRPTVPEAVNIGRCGGPSRPKRRPNASRRRPEARGNDEFLMSNDERMTKSKSERVPSVRAATLIYFDLACVGLIVGGDLLRDGRKRQNIQLSTCNGCPPPTLPGVNTRDTVTSQ